MTERTCGTCRHFHPDSGDLRVGQCRARAPSPVMLGLRQSPAGSVPVVEGFFAPVIERIPLEETRERLIEEIGKKIG